MGTPFRAGVITHNFLFVFFVRIVETRHALSLRYDTNPNKKHHRTTFFTIHWSSTFIFNKYNPGVSMNKD